MNRSCEDRVTLRLMDLHPNCIELAVNIFGYVIPVLALIVSVVNILVVIVFMKPQIRSQTTMILTLIACADMVGIVCPAGVFAYHYLFGYYRELLTCSQTEWTYIFGEICVDMFNMFSLWLTVLLAFIRCKCIKSPFVAGHVHSTRRIAAYIIGIICLVCIVHIPSFFIFNFQPVEVVNPRTNLTETVCGLLETEGIFLKSCSRRKLHILMETLLDSIVPCVFLMYFNSVMLFTLREAKRTRSSLRQTYSFVKKRNSEVQKEHIGSKESLHFENKDRRSKFKGKGDKCSLDGNQETKCSSIQQKRNEENGHIHPSCVKLIFCFNKQRCDTKKGGSSTSSDPTLDKLDKESRRTSWLILVVSSTIVVHEIPLAISNTYALASHTNTPLPLTTNGCFSMILTLWQFITYPVIFLIYACMSKAFRSELWKTLNVKRTCEDYHTEPSNKRRPFLSPGLERMHSVKQKETFEGPSRDKSSENDDVFDSPVESNKHFDYEISS